MLSEKTIRELVSMPCFISNASKLAYMLHMSHQDASQELLLELLDHRLRLWTNKDVTLAIQRDLPSLKWRIKYAAKDYYRRVNKDANRELTKAQMLAGMESTSSTDEETLKALERLPLLFKNKATQNWTESVLRVGQKETMVRFGQTPRQFCGKLVKVCKYARQHRQSKQRSHTKELKLLNEWNSFMTNEDTSDNDIQDFINSHQDYINELINSSQVAYQRCLIKDYCHAGKDRYILANLMEKREQELDRRVNK